MERANFANAWQTPSRVIFDDTIAPNKYRVAMASTRSYREQAPPPINTGRPRPRPVQGDYDFRVGGPEDLAHRRGYNRPQDSLTAQQVNSVYNQPHDLMSAPPPPPPPPPLRATQQQQQKEEPDANAREEALLDLDQLEQLHHEAERMKALGNKHMAAQVRHLFEKH